MPSPEASRLIAKSTCPDVGACATIDLNPISGAWRYAVACPRLKQDIQDVCSTRDKAYQRATRWLTDLGCPLACFAQARARPARPAHSG
jgi:hypothetical protein